MTQHIEARSTINMPGLPVGQVRIVDPENPHIAMCLREGHLVATGREFSVPTQNARGAVRPQATQEPAETAAPVKKKRKRAPKKTTPPS